jgi:hypothetical protein
MKERTNAYVYIQIARRFKYASQGPRKKIIWMQSQRHLDTTRFGIALVAALRTPLFLSGHLLRPETHSLAGMALPQSQLWRLKTGIMQIRVLRRLCVILAL